MFDDVQADEVGRTLEGKELYTIDNDKIHNRTFEPPLLNMPGGPTEESQESLINLQKVDSIKPGDFDASKQASTVQD